MTPAPGTQLGPYEVTRQLASGGMGVVYEALDPRLKRTVAIKLLPPDLTTDDTAKQRFLQEAQAASALDHPNICTIYDVGETDDGQLYLVMAHYQGETLKDRIARGPLSVDEAVDIATQVGQGLAKAHAAGIVHRDIKPANLMVTTDGPVKILDFGLAKLAGMEGVTQTGTTVGTVAYMSPEQARGEDVDHRTDIWSLGVVLYEMLAGKPPFRGENLLSLAEAIRGGEPEPLTGEAGSLDSVLRKALNKDSGQRCQAVADLVGELRSPSALPAAPAVDVAEPETPSLAVLPFADLSPEQDQQYFCDGLAEELIDALARLDGLRVVGRTSSFQFRGKGLDLREVGEKLRVTAVLEGSVRKAGSRLRVTAQLVNAEDGYHLWSERYDRELTDVFAVQDDIATSVVQKLRATLLSQSAPQLVPRGTISVDAYDHYLTARDHMRDWVEAGAITAIQHLDAAIQLDPTFAKAYAAAAECYILRSVWGTMPGRDAYPLARSRAVEALARDDTVPDAHSALASCLAWYEQDWTGADREYRQALALGPQRVDTYLWYSAVLLMMGRGDEAMSMVTRGCELDPLSPLLNAHQAQWWLYVGQPDRAEREATLMKQRFPRFYILPYTQVLAGWKRRDADAVFSGLSEALHLVGRSQYLEALFTAALFWFGRHDEAERRFDQLQTDAKTQYVGPSAFAFVHAGRRDADQTIQWIQRAKAEYDSLFPWLRLLFEATDIVTDERVGAMLIDSLELPVRVDPSSVG